jgi:uncharacterized RDD family membrane protein YckC
MGAMDGRPPNVDRATLVMRAWAFVIRGVLVTAIVVAIVVVILL